jgi:pimeloyl-ACP methyl ester carboxylesterase
MSNQFTVSGAREQRLALPDGRMLAIAEYGPPDGVPLVFVAGAGSSRAMNAYGPAAAGRNVRMITFDRPGLGESTWDPRKSLSSVAEDLGFALERIRVSLPLALANSQGAPFALAGTAAGLFRRTALVSPADEVAHPEVRKRLSGDQAGFVASVADEPEAMARHLSAFDADGMFDFVLSGAAPSDAIVFDRPDFRVLFRRALEEGFAQGGTGYAQDTILASSPWSIDPAAVKDVQIWFGADDSAHSPDLGSTLARRFAAERYVVDGIGGALLWSRTGMILDRLLDAGP